MDRKYWKLFRSLEPVFASSVKWAQLIGYSFYHFRNSQDVRITELIEMGDYYGEKDLIKRSGKQLSLFINNGNALKFYNVAVKHELEDVQERVLGLVSGRINYILRSKEFNEMSQDAKTHFMQKLVKEYDLAASKRPSMK